jgi:hypothetical protein
MQSSLLKLAKKLEGQEERPKRARAVLGSVIGAAVTCAATHISGNWYKRQLVYYKQTGIIVLL